ncbi:MAG: L-serine ammonia-lyase, iron-sulfur-dependent subunit beta [Oscillospiraceae bacterium]|nr:L-serine ammonia-lyase, iron-sulfur-dependent subunit beta [Oscillospiraceae bacterium]
MELSIFDVLGPVMIGPSSSHTAGAARLSRIAGLIAGNDYKRVRFGLYGSFEKTYRGHGTDRALVAGALGLKENDERLSKSFELAKKAGLEWEFYPDDLDGLHENSVRMTFTLADGSEREIIGCSVGGGQIVIRYIDGFETEITARSVTLIVMQHDRPGVISHITSVLSENGINIGVMKLSRRGKGDLACTVIETDTPISDDIVKAVGELEDIIRVQALNLREEDN